jgi:hypothetical protein
MVEEDDLNKKFKTLKPNMNSHKEILSAFNESLEYLNTN